MSQNDQRLALLDRSQPLLLMASIGVGLGIGATTPQFAVRLLPLVSIGVFLLIYLVMVGIDLGGLAASPGRRRFVATAVVLNFVVNPLVAWGLASTFLGSHPDLAIGLILFLVTPCIGWYLIFTELAGGDAGLGITLLGVNIALQIVLLPLYVYVFVGQQVGVDLGSIAVSIGLFLVLPLGLAALTRFVLRIGTISFEQIRDRAHVAHLKTIVLAVVIVSMFASHADDIFDNPGVVLRLIVPVTLFFAVAFGLALLIGRAMGFPYPQVALLTFTTTSRNSEASLAIAATAFSSPFVALTVVMGPVIELPLLVLMVRVLHGLRPRISNQPLTRKSTPHDLNTSRIQDGAVQPR